MLSVLVLGLMVLSFGGCSSDNNDIIVKDIEEAVVKLYTSYGVSNQEIEEFRKEFKKPETQKAFMKDIQDRKNLGYSKKEIIEAYLAQSEEGLKKEAEKRRKKEEAKKNNQDWIMNGQGLSDEDYQKMFDNADKMMRKR